MNAWLGSLREEPNLRRDLLSFALASGALIVVVTVLVGIYGYYFSTASAGSLDAEYWTSFGTAAQGIAGTVVAFFGAAFGIALASLGLRIARTSDEREHAAMVKQTLESAIEPFTPLAPTICHVFSSIHQRRREVSHHAEEMMLWVVLRNIAETDIYALPEDRRPKRTEVAATFAQLVKAYPTTSRPGAIGSINPLQAKQRFGRPPYPCSSFLKTPVDVFGNLVRELRQAFDRLERSPVAMQALFEPHDKVYKTLPRIREWLHIIDARWSERPRTLDAAGTYDNDRSLQVGWWTWFSEAAFASSLAMPPEIDAQGNWVPATKGATLQIIWPFLNPNSLSQTRLEGASPELLMQLIALLPTKNNIEHLASQLLEPHARPSALQKQRLAAIEANCVNACERSVADDIAEARSNWMQNSVYNPISTFSDAALLCGLTDDDRLKMRNLARARYGYPEESPDDLEYYEGLSSEAGSCQSD